jgi:hypothetical protein
MCYDPLRRLSAMKALSHPWLGSYAAAAPPSPQDRQPPRHGNIDSSSSSSFLTPTAYRNNKNAPSSGKSVGSAYSTPGSNSRHPNVQGKGTRSNSNDVLDMVLHPHYNADIQGMVMIF